MTEKALRWRKQRLRQMWKELGGRYLIECREASLAPYVLFWHPERGIPWARIADCSRLERAKEIAEEHESRLRRFRDIEVCKAADEEAFER